MNRALLAELQGQRCYPSVTVLINTTPGRAISGAEAARARELIDQAGTRMDGTTDDAIRKPLLEKLERLLDDHLEAATAAIALCASSEYDAAVRLGRPVDERVIVDETFATRDLVADLNRTALFRVITVSDRLVRVFVGDRRRLAEEDNDRWPLEREDDQSTAVWTRLVAERLREERSEHPMPTVVAGVERRVRQLPILDEMDKIGVISGNHDRAGWVELHNAAWPLVSDWLRTDNERAIASLDEARAQHRYAGGLDEVWPLAREGRVELLVVEDRYAVPARIGNNGQLEPVEQLLDDPSVLDDAVDDAIETVLRQGGNVIIVADDALHEHQRVAAKLRY